LSDTQVYEPEIRALLETASHFCKVVVHKSIEQWVEWHQWKRASLEGFHCLSSHPAALTAFLFNVEALVERPGKLWQRDHKSPKPSIRKPPKHSTRKPSKASAAAFTAFLFTVEALGLLDRFGGEVTGLGVHAARQGSLLPDRVFARTASRWS
jgi:hypothetical protein